MEKRKKQLKMSKVTDITPKENSRITCEETQSKRPLHQRVLDCTRSVYSYIFDRCNSQRDKLLARNASSGSCTSCRADPTSGSNFVKSKLGSRPSSSSLIVKRSNNGPPSEAVRRSSGYANHENNHIDTGHRNMHVEEASAIQAKPLPPRPANPVYRLPPDLGARGASSTQLNEWAQAINSKDLSWALVHLWLGQDRLCPSYLRSCTLKTPHVQRKLNLKTTRTTTLYNLS